MLQSFSTRGYWRGCLQRYRLKKAYGTKNKKLFGVLLLDRLSGLLLLFVYACLLALNPKLPIAIRYKITIVLAMGLSPIVYWIVVKKWFSYSLPVFWKSLLLSALVQFSQLLCVFFIVLALGMETDILAYLLIFLLSSIAAVLPLTIGGIGSREVTFLYGSGFLGLDETLSISLSICFFLMTALVSLLVFGIISNRYTWHPLSIANPLGLKSAMPPSESSPHRWHALMKMHQMHSAQYLFSCFRIQELQGEPCDPKLIYGILAVPIHSRLP